MEPRVILTLLEPKGSIAPGVLSLVSPGINRVRKRGLRREKGRKRRRRTRALSQRTVILKRGTQERNIGKLWGKQTSFVEFIENRGTLECSETTVREEMQRLLDDLNCS